MIDLLTTPQFLAAVLTAVVAFGFLLLKRRHALADDQRTLQRESAAALRTALGPVRDVVEHHAEPTPAVPLSSRRVSEALKPWGLTWDEHAHRLPLGARHMRRSLRAALGEDLGLAAHGDTDDIGVGYPLAEPDPEWCENARDYLDELRGWLNDWHDHPAVAAKNPPPKFDDWLHQRAQRGYDSRHGLFTRTDRLLHRLTGSQEDRP